MEDVLAALPQAVVVERAPVRDVGLDELVDTVKEPARDGLRVHAESAREREASASERG